MGLKLDLVAQNNDDIAFSKLRGQDRREILNKLDDVTVYSINILQADTKNKNFSLTQKITKTLIDTAKGIQVSLL